MGMIINSKEFEYSVKNATQDMIDDMERKVKECCMLVVAEAKETAPFDEGHLAGATDFEVVNDKDKIIGYIGSNIEYAPYVHEGTGIYARNGKGRKTPWVWHGEGKKWRGKFFTRGQKPKPYLEKAIYSKKDEISKHLGGK